MVWSRDLSNHWKFLRAFCWTHLFSSKAVESQAALRKEKVSEMTDFLSSRKGKTVKNSEILFGAILNTLGNLFFSKDLCDLDYESSTKLGAMPNISDFYPLFDALDLQGLRKQTELYQNQLQAISRGRSDFLDVMIDSGFSDLQINISLPELIVVGSDTTTSTIEWARAELLRNNGAMHKLQAELTSKIGENDIITESNISELPYLAACVKETLRIHPPTPFLIPRHAPETCKIMDYSIPKNSSSYHLVGRRICPGLPFARQEVHLILASLIHHFKWSLPNGEDPMQLDMKEKFGVTLQKEKSLLVVPI
ncbi:hypothetical protein R3W88_008732 [Solanum pinnatisectum]|uniref:Cytochrome P450 n=1 Tax=Solanum pinnatisectum TaxID=50273 RepID=A0AAV9M8X3_9SOLN|nr:hypothetical protein R3W88_008732 [Solanum pinnatisectum]